MKKHLSNGEIKEIYSMISDYHKKFLEKYGVNIDVLLVVQRKVSLIFIGQILLPDYRKPIWILPNH